ncbi:MAG: elongation factor G [Proteobacteria bacterium]|nr:elongation factor G [Pseudomonadota bacterium]
MGEFEKKWNIALVAHGGAGKTTLADVILYNGKVVDKIGRVDDGTSNFDFEPEEVTRKISISSSFHHITWNKNYINILDTPGYANFLTDTEFCLKAATGAVLIVSAISGVKVETHTLWNLLTEWRIPRIAFVSKMDRERADFLKAVDDIEKDLKVTPVPLQFPIGTEADFKGIVDLIKKEAYFFENNGSGIYKKGEIPQDIMGEVERLRDFLIEKVAEVNDELTEKYLEGIEITEEELINGLKLGAMTHQFLPVLCGSSFKNIGVSHLLDWVVKILPSADEVPDAIGINPNTGNEERRKRVPEAPFSAFVFKTYVDAFAGKVSVARIFSGKITPESTVYNATQKEKEKIGNIMIIEGKKYKPINLAQAGDIVAFPKLKNVKTGDTLCDESAPIVYKGPDIPEPAISFAAIPKSRADEDKLSNAISKIIEEDPTIRFAKDEQTKEFLLSGVGQTHVEITLEKLKRKYGVEIELKTPKVPYKETIKGRVQVQGKYKKQSGGHGQYGDCWIEVEPLPRGAGFEFVDKIVGGVIPRQYIPAVEKGIREAMQEGVLAGYPVVDVKVTLYDGSFHPVDSSDLAFQIAGSLAFKKAAQQANPVLLEPIMDLEVITPEDCLGDVIGDINSKRGHVVGVEPKANSQIVRAKVPMAEILKYANDLKSMTSGRALFHVKFSHYEEVPTHLSEKIIQQAKKEKEESK